MSTNCPKCQTENTPGSKFCSSCGFLIDSIDKTPVSQTKTSETPIEELTTGSTFADRYQIIEELGKGGMGRVYKALDKEINEKIAIKLIKPEIASDKKTIERFRNELTTARKISHRNVCSMFDLNKESGNYYIAMEYVSGGDLKRLIRRVGQLPSRKAISIAKQICEGLSEAHSLGIVHRDLKPNNIMIDDNGNARIMDFGIARTVKDKGITGSGVMIGTPEYMSPEQVEAKEVDQRSDIYSLGVILYEMTTGRLPFDGDTPLAIAMKHKGETAKNPKEYNPQIGDDLNRVILNCLEKDKEKRYQSAGELRSELERIEQGIPTTDRIESKKKPLTSKEITVTFKLRKRIVPALIVLAIVVIVLILWSPWAQRETSSIPGKKPSIAVLPFKDLSPQKDQESLCEGFAEALINALAKIKDLRVPAITSSFFFKDKEINLQDIGRELNVKTVLEGSVQKSGDKLRISVRLVNVEDDDVLWTEQYDYVLDDFFSIQDDISLKIVDNLKINLLGNEKEGITKRYTQNMEAFNLYLQGRSFWNKRIDEDLWNSINYYEKAIEIDPNYALAFAGKADSYVTIMIYSPSLGKEVLPGAKQAALKALEIDDTLAEAHSALAMITAAEMNVVGAEQEFKRAIELNPNYAHAHHWYAYMLGHLGRTDEALEEINRAHDLDPLSIIINKNVGLVNYWARNYDKAIEATKKTLEMDPDFTGVRAQLAMIYIANSMYEEALSELENEKKLTGWGPGFKAAGVGITYARMGEKDKAEQILSELTEASEQGGVPLKGLVFLCIALGKNDQAFVWLEKEVEETGFPIDIIVSPFYDGIRKDPRFINLLIKSGLK